VPVLSRSGAIHDVSRIYSSVGCRCTEGRHYAKTQSIKGFSLKSLTLIEQGLPFLPPRSYAASLSWSREPRGASETAFALRQDHHMVELIAAWEPQDDEQRHLQWAQNISQAPPCLEGGYISLLDRKNRRGLLGRTMSACSTLKRKYDPDVSIDDRTSRTHSPHGKTLTNHRRS